MSTFEVTGIRLESSASGTHEHISHVRIGRSSPDLILQRQTVVSDLRNPVGDRYYTEAKGQRAKVVVVTCPHHCGFGDYLRTDPDTTTANNLLSLPHV